MEPSLTVGLLPRRGGRVQCLGLRRNHQSSIINHQHRPGLMGASWAGAVARLLRRASRPTLSLSGEQKAPDAFSFAGSANDAYRMIGNGVSVPVGKWIGSEIKRYFQ